VIADGNKRIRVITDISVAAVFLLQCLATVATYRLMAALEVFFADIVVPLPDSTERMLALGRISLLVFPVLTVVTGVLGIYYFWRRRKPEYDPSGVMFCIGLCAFIHLFVTILLFMYLGPTGFEVGLP